MPVCSLCEMNRLTNRRRSDGTHLDGRHGICGLCDGSSWHCIAKWDTLSWLDHTRFCITVRVSKQEQMMFESSSKNRKIWGGRQMVRQCIRLRLVEWFTHVDYILAPYKYCVYYYYYYYYYSRYPKLWPITSLFWQGPAPQFNKWIDT